MDLSPSNIPVTCHCFDMFHIQDPYDLYPLWMFTFDEFFSQSLDPGGHTSNILQTSLRIL